MYYGKKKGIIIGITVAVIVVILAIVGVILATQTDMFKSNQKLFWKYAFAYPEESVTLNQITETGKLMQEEPYTLTGELSLGSSDTELDKALGLVKLKIDAEEDKSNEYTHINNKVTLASEDFISFDVVQDQNVLGIKSDEIVTAYLGIRNENLKVLAQKFGITGVDFLPDKITEDKIDNYAELLEISEEEISHIFETYKDIIIENIPSANYTKQTKAVIQKEGVSYTTTAYRLDLSAQEVQGIALKILQTLKTDSRTLDLIYQKASLLATDDSSISRDTIETAIDEAIEKLEEIEFEDMAFVVYNYKGQNIQTEILVKNQQKYTINKDIGRLIVKIEDLSGESSISNAVIDLEYKTTTTQISAVLKVTIDDLEMLELSISNSGSASQGGITTDINATIIPSEDSESYELDYTQEIEFVDEIEETISLDETNCAILNDYTQEQIQGLLQALIERINVVIVEKSQIINNLITNDTAMNRAQQNNSVVESENTTSDIQMQNPSNI